MKERCPRCAFTFEREEGFFLGAYTINLAIAEGLLLILAIVPLIVLLNANPDMSVRPILLIGLVAAVVAPLVFYPFSRTIWSAIDLVLRPPDRSEPSDRHHAPAHHAPAHHAPAHHAQARRARDQREGDQPKVSS
jgi:hypothetical protein